MDSKLGKGLVAGAMGLSLAFGATGMIVGLTAKGNPGKSAYELAVENGFTGSETEWLASLKGATGDTGVQGPGGATGGKGPTGTSVYAGYDNYIWKGSERTEFKIEAEVPTSTFENTMSVAGVMSNYFEHEYLNVTNTPVALMANYMPTIGKTQYSGVPVTNIQVYTENAGTLYIGTAKVADVVASRTTGATLNVTSTSHNVVAGANTIALKLEVAEDETIVLGGSGSTAKLFAAKGVAVDDEAGNFAYIDNNTHTDIVSTTGEYADTLAVAVATSAAVESRVMGEDVTAIMPNTAFASNTNVSTSGGPYRYTTDYFRGKNITKIGIPVGTVSSLAVNPYITIYVINANEGVTRNGIIRKIKAEIDRTTLSSTTVNAWVYSTIFRDSSGNVLPSIELGANETIAFGAYTGEAGYVADTITWKYMSAVSATAEKYSFRDGASGATTTSQASGKYNNILFDVYALDGIIAEKHIENLLAEEEAAKTQQG